MLYTYDKTLMYEFKMFVSSRVFYSIFFQSLSSNDFSHLSGLVQEQGAELLSAKKSP